MESFLRWLESIGFKHTRGDIHYAGSGWWYPMLPDITTGAEDPHPPEPWVRISQDRESKAVFIEASFAKGAYTEDPDVAMEVVTAMMQAYDEALGAEPFAPPEWQTAPELVEERASPGGQSLSEEHWARQDRAWQERNASAIEKTRRAKEGDTSGPFVSPPWKSKLDGLGARGERTDPFALSDFEAMLENAGFERVRMSPEEIATGEQWWTRNWERSYIFVAVKQTEVRINWWQHPSHPGGASAKSLAGGVRFFHWTQIPESIRYLQKLSAAADEYDEGGSPRSLGRFGSGTTGPSRQEFENWLTAAGFGVSYLGYNAPYNMEEGDHWQFPVLVAPKILKGRPYIPLYGGGSYSPETRDKSWIRAVIPPPSSGRSSFLVTEHVEGRGSARPQVHGDQLSLVYSLDGHGFEKAKRDLSQMLVQWDQRHERGLNGFEDAR